MHHGWHEKCSAVQCSAVQCSAVQCSAVQCSAVQCSAVQCSAVPCRAVQCSAVQCIATAGTGDRTRKLRRGRIQINQGGQSMWIVCMIPPEKSDTCGLMLGNPGRDLFRICM